MKTVTLTLTRDHARRIEIALAAYAAELSYYGARADSEGEREHAFASAAEYRALRNRVAQQIRE